MSVAADQCLAQALHWLRSSPIRTADGGYQAVYEPSTGRYVNWGQGRYAEAAVQAGRWVVTQTMDRAGGIREVVVIGRASLRERFLNTYPTWQAIFVSVFDALEELTHDGRF